MASARSTLIATMVDRKGVGVWIANEKFQKPENLLQLHHHRNVPKFARTLAGARGTHGGQKKDRRRTLFQLTFFEG